MRCEVWGWLLEVRLIFTFFDLLNDNLKGVAIMRIKRFDLLSAMRGTVAVAGVVVATFLTSEPALAITSCPQSSITDVTLNGEQTFSRLISYNDPASCATINGMGHQYNFVGKAGQKIYIEVTPGESYVWPYIYLKYPVAGSFEAAGGGYYPVRVPQSGYMTLPIDGDYWLFVSNKKTGGTGGPYTLKIGTDTLTPESGWWWNPAEAGRGFAIEKQGTMLMVAGFLYDAAGNATWYMSAGSMTDASTYSDTLDTFSGGQCIDCVYKAPTSTTSGAGSIEIKFTSAKKATVKWKGGEFPIERFYFGQ